MNTFDSFFKSFKQSSAWDLMRSTVEASPWHREQNVAVHTEMVLDQYNTRFAHERSDTANKIARFALLYHDIGKPASEEILEKKEEPGVKFRRYAGHEQVSAVEFMQEYVRNSELQAQLTMMQARAVRWIIEHHLPYGITDGLKRRSLAAGTHHALGAEYETFFDCLRSDAAGRISDDHAQKLQKVEEWITEFKTLPTQFEHKRKNGAVLRPEQTMFILIGPSGSGKSTWIKNRAGAQDRVISFDELKLQFFESEAGDHVAMYNSPIAYYDAAWQYCTIDHEKEFKLYAQQRAKEITDDVNKVNGDLYIDIVNASKKKRAQWVELGRRQGYQIVAVEFWNTFETLAARQLTRPEKSVPNSSIKDQLSACTCAWLGAEADEVIIVMGKP